MLDRRVRKSPVTKDVHVHSILFDFLGGVVVLICLTWNEWNICSTSEITPTLSLLNLIRTSSRLFIMSGPGSKTLFKEILLYSHDESKTTYLICLFGPYTPNHSIFIQCSCFFRRYRDSMTSLNRLTHKFDVISLHV